MGAAPRRFGWSAHRGRRRAPSSPGRPCFDRGAPSPLGDVDGKGQTDCLAGRTLSLNSPLRSRKPAASRPPDLGQSRSSEWHALTARPGGSCSKKTIRGGDHSKKTHPIEHLLMRFDQSPTNIQIMIRSSSIGSWSSAMLIADEPVGRTPRIAFDCRGCVRLSSPIDFRADTSSAASSDSCRRGRRAMRLAAPLTVRTPTSRRRRR
jgi:hypothetical protein